MFIGQAEAHDFDPGGGIDVCQQITIPQGGVLRVSFQWDQPFFSVSGPPGSASDMNILLLDAACGTVLAQGAEGNLGRDALEIFTFDNSGGATTFNLAIFRFAGPSPGLMKMITLDGSFDEFRTNSGTSFGHPNASGGLGVGAAFYAETPAFGNNPPAIESFSSAGGVPILFDNAGNRLPAPLFRPQPAITAPDGTDTTFFDQDRDGNGRPDFIGTSAAAPHAAGVAALLKDLAPSATPDAIYGAMKGTRSTWMTQQPSASTWGSTSALASASSRQMRLSTRLPHCRQESRPARLHRVTLAPSLLGALAPQAILSLATRQRLARRPRPHQRQLQALCNGLTATIIGTPGRDVIRCHAHGGAGDAPPGGGGRGRGGSDVGSRA